MANAAKPACTNARFARAQDFIEALRGSPNITAAAEAAGIARRTAYVWRESDPEFAAAWDDALEGAVDKLEEAAWRRAATDSDRLMEILLKAHRPKYREKQAVEVTGANGGPIEHRIAAELEIRELFGETPRG